MKEKAPGVFYFRSRAFLHFHEDAGALYADIRPPGARDFSRIPLGDGSEGAALTATLQAALE